MKPIGHKSTGISNISNVNRNVVARCAKFHGLPDSLRESEHDNEITQKMLHEAHQFHKNIE